MIWALDLDDFNNRCGQGKHPLLSVIRDVLSVPKGSYPGLIDGSGDNTIVGDDSDMEEEDDSEEQGHEQEKPGTVHLIVL